MNYKLLLKFYFGAERLNGVLDGVIMRTALASAGGGCESYAERIAEIIEVKDRLNELWLFLDGVLSGMGEGDVASLKSYSARRGRWGEGKESAEHNREKERREHNALVKLSRRLHGKLNKYERQVNALKGYAARLAG